MKDIVVISLFDGISCGRLALNKCNINVLRYYSSEINQEAINIANINNPQDKPYRLGCVTQIDGLKLKEEIKKGFGNVDIMLIGGSPCTGFSNAGNKLNFEDKQSKLFFSYIDLLKTIKPKYFLLENVKMKAEWKDVISSILGSIYPESVNQQNLFNAGCLEPVLINSSLLSVQNRERLYWSNIPFEKPSNTYTDLNDILECGYSYRMKARCLLESDSRPLANALKMVHRDLNKGFTTVIYKSEEHYLQIKKHFNQYFKRKSSKEIEIYLSNNESDLSIYDGVRYLTRKELEICQTLPIDYCSSVDRNTAAGAIGNGWTVDVIAYIFKNIC